MKRRKKRSDPFLEIAEAVISLAVESGIPEELIDHVECISDGELELWMVGAWSPVGMEADDCEELAIANDSELRMIPRKNRLNSGLSLALPMQKILTDVPRLKAGRVNRGKLRLVSGDSSNSKTQSSTRKP